MFLADHELSAGSKVTVSYLTIPSTAAKTDLFSDHWKYSEGVHGMQSAVVDLESLVLQAETHKKRLRHAMASLSLDVHLHAEQLKSGTMGISATVNYGPYEFEASRARRHSQSENLSEAEKSRLSRLSWPQPLMLIKHGDEKK